VNEEQPDAADRLLDSILGEGKEPAVEPAVNAELIAGAPEVPIEGEQQ
jgi:hypothetical protein